MVHEQDSINHPIETNNTCVALSPCRDSVTLAVRSWWFCRKLPGYGGDRLPFRDGREGDPSHSKPQLRLLQTATPAFWMPSWDTFCARCRRRAGCIGSWCQKLLKEQRPWATGVQDLNSHDPNLLFDVVSLQKLIIVFTCLYYFNLFYTYTQYMQLWTVKIHRNTMIWGWSSKWLSSASLHRLLLETRSSTWKLRNFLHVRARTGRYDHHCQWRYAPWPGCSRCCLLSKSIVKLGCLNSSNDSHCDSWILTCHDGLWAMRVDCFCELEWNTLKYEIRNAMRAEIEAGANVPWHHRIAHGFD